MSDPWAIDTNVGIVANNRPHDGEHLLVSVVECVKFLNEIMTSGSIALDTSREILSEYGHKMRSEGQPGIGDKFLKWALTNQANPNRCRQVDITEIAVPDQLVGFREDEKFFQTALGCQKPQIAEAVDGLWWKRRADFEACGITAKFLCPEEIAANSDRKHGPDS